MVIFSPVGSGERRPDASGSPSFITSRTACCTAPFSSPRYSTGLCKVRNVIPSSLACFTSSRRAGISCSERRYTNVTFAPRRFAVRQESIAVLPPPTTSTFLPRLIGVSVFGLAASMRFTRVRYSLDDIMLMRFSPGIFMKFGSPAPEATKIPLKPCASSSSVVIDLPTITSVWK